MTNAKYYILQIGYERSIVQVRIPKLSKMSKIKNILFNKEISPIYVPIGEPYIIDNNDLMTLDEMGFVL